MKRVLEQATADANALFSDRIGRSVAAVPRADEAKAFSVYHTEYSSLKTAAKKPVAKEAIIAAAGSALEAVQLLKQRAAMEDGAPRIGTCLVRAFGLHLC